MYYPSGSYHGAIDYGVPAGTPVYAAADGVVIKTANLTTSYGTYVVIQHANGIKHGMHMVLQDQYVYLLDKQFQEVNKL